MPPAHIVNAQRPVVDGAAEEPNGARQVTLGPPALPWPERRSIGARSGAWSAPTLPTAAVARAFWPGSTWGRASDWRAALPSARGQSRPQSADGQARRAAADNPPR